MFLAGDIGGTNTRLARVVVRDGSYDVRDVSVYESASYTGLEPILTDYLARCPGPVAAAGFGIAGPVQGNAVKTTNLPWDIDGARLEKAIGAPVALANDLEAAAHGVVVVAPDALTVLQEGLPREGNRVVIAAGTGLGEALLFWHAGTWWPSASEGGHCGFAPRDDDEVELWRFLRARFGHVSYERVVSGAGLVLIYEFFRAFRRVETPLPWSAGEDRAAAVARAAQCGDDSAASAALRLFCTAYGAKAGNLALTALAYGGVYLAGGIAPKILPFLAAGPFLEGFLDKGRYRELLARVPVMVVRDEHLGLRGAARAAAFRAGG